MIKIREFNQTDKDELLSLVIESNVTQKRDIEQERVNKDEIKEGTTKNFNDYLNEDSLKYFVAEENRMLVGFVQAELSQIYVGSGFINSLFVLEQYRRKGVGRKLLEKAIVWLKEGDVKEISLSVHLDNKSAIELYSKFGFADKPETYKSMQLKVD